MNSKHALSFLVTIIVGSVVIGATLPTLPIDFTANDAALNAYVLAYEGYRNSVGDLETATVNESVAAAAVVEAQAALDAAEAAHVETVAELASARSAAESAQGAAHAAWATLEAEGQRTGSVPDGGGTTAVPELRRIR